MNGIPDIYRYKAERGDTLLYREVYNYFQNHGATCGESEEYGFGDAYPRTSGSIKFQNLNVHLQSQPSTPGGLFRRPRGMILELTAVGGDIEGKLEDVIQSFNFQLEEKNIF